MTKRVLVVEDDVFLAIDLAEQLEQHGFEIVGPFLNNQDALMDFQSGTCDAAVLDINLGRETSEPVAQTLKDSNVPFIVVSGSLSSPNAEIFENAPALSKPIEIDQLLSLLGPPD